MIAHAIYNDNKHLVTNSGQVNNTMSWNYIATFPQTQSNLTQQSSFSWSSEQIGEIFCSSWSQAAKSGFDYAKHWFLHEGTSSIKPPEPDMPTDMSGHMDVKVLSPENDKLIENAISLQFDSHIT